MPNESAAQLAARQANFTVFHQELAQVLVDFIGRIGIEPAAPVLKQAAQYVPLVEQALRDMAVADEADRTWLTARIAYFLGEVFVQQYDGCWYVNDAPGSPLHARYVVGKFAKPAQAAMPVDPFGLAQAYVAAPVPRGLATLLADMHAKLEGDPRFLRLRACSNFCVAAEALCPARTGKIKEKCTVR